MSKMTETNVAASSGGDVDAQSAGSARTFQSSCKDSRLQGRAARPEHNLHKLHELSTLENFHARVCCSAYTFYIISPPIETLGLRVVMCITQSVDGDGSRVDPVEPSRRDKNLT